MGVAGGDVSLFDSLSEVALEKLNSASPEDCFRERWGTSCLSTIQDK